MSATYPRRWFAAIVFASIIALTAGSYMAVWAAGELDSVSLNISSITVGSETSRTFTATAVDSEGGAATEVTFVFSVVGGGGSITSNGVFTAPAGPATTSVQVVASQDGSPSATSTAIITVNAPKAAADATPVPVNPGPVPAPPPPSTAGGDSETITPAEGGSVSITTGGRSVSVSVPSSAVDDFVSLDIAPVASASVPPVPSALRVKITDTVVDLTFSDTDGNPIDDFTAGRSVTITMSFTSADALEAGGAQNLTILKFDELTEDWVALPTTVNFATSTISASVKTFSLFGVGIRDITAPISTATAGGALLPATGDVAPGNRSVIAFIVIGVMLMTGGLIVVRRRQLVGAK